MNDPGWQWGDYDSTQYNTKKNNLNEENFLINNPINSVTYNNATKNSENQNYLSTNYFTPFTTNSDWQNFNTNVQHTFKSTEIIGDTLLNQQKNLNYNNPVDNFFNQKINQQSPEYSNFSQKLISDPLFNTARQIGGQFAEQQREKFTKYLSSFRLKYYFSVDTTYVGKKLGIILFPFLHRDWTTKFNQTGEPLCAKDDLNAPDLYIPLMAFITYVLISGFVFGLQKRFSPEKLGILTTNALFYLVFENVLVFVTKYVLNISQSLNVWHALSYSSYKFVGMVFCLLLYLCGGGSVYYFGLAYCIFATVFFLLRSLKTFILDMSHSNDGGRKRKLYLLLSITILQSLIMWLLTSSVTSYMPVKYDFAKMAIGLAKSGSLNGQIPYKNNVDYEKI